VLDGRRRPAPPLAPPLRRARATCRPAPPRLPSLRPPPARGPSPLAAFPATRRVAAAWPCRSVHSGARLRDAAGPFRLSPPCQLGPGRSGRPLARRPHGGSARFGWSCPPRFNARRCCHPASPPRVAFPAPSCPARSISSPSSLRPWPPACLVRPLRSAVAYFARLSFSPPSVSCGCRAPATAPPPARFRRLRPVRCALPPVPSLPPPLAPSPLRPAVLQPLVTGAGVARKVRASAFLDPSACGSISWGVGRSRLQPPALRLRACGKPAGLVSAPRLCPAGAARP